MDNELKNAVDSLVRSSNEVARLIDLREGKAVLKLLEKTVVNDRLKAYLESKPNGASMLELRKEFGLKAVTLRGLLSKLGGVKIQGESRARKYSL